MKKDVKLRLKEKNDLRNKGKNPCFLFFYQNYEKNVKSS